MKEKGFTLIELLAVIVILAIIALIAVPIVINIIRDTKEKAIKINAENYMNAVELAVADGHMVKGEKVLISGTYDIIENGKKIKLIKDDKENEVSQESPIELSVEYTGEGLKDGTVKLIDGKVRGLTGVKTNEGHDILIILGEVKIIKDSKPVTLTKGSNFNAKIKTMVSDKETKYDVTDTIVKSIEFLGYGIIPSGYTLEEFQKLERVDVSSNNDETIYAIYDGKDKVYVYAEDKTLFSKDSSYMFYNFNSVEIIDFGEYVNTSQVTSMHSMFQGCSSLTTLNINNFDTNKVTNMQAMFTRCSSLTTLDLSCFDTGQITSMYGMFRGCSSLTSLDVSNFETSKVTNMGAMFDGCSSLTIIDLRNWDTTNVTDMSWMFSGCSKLTSLDVSKFDTSKVINMGYMFNNCSSLKTLHLGNWNTSQVTNVQRMFRICSDLTSLYLSNFDTSKVTNMSAMFVGCKNLTSLDISSFNTGNVKTMYHMFDETINLKPIYVGTNWVIKEGTDVTSMFSRSKTKNVEELCEPESTEEWCVVTN